ncbi:cAMP-binding domain of CRP or a regulatory subunit of cAMP-dependent protein kinases [Clostridium cavendishii DSM 21758]|uniref:cAMP-binding domain of CRP or a regulatory subunit of cAMP-dependent protein kinases n=1 Tax=Clostridium cavendishii DSM 21758 TaxID=1121302 RepID=A0A1M6GHD7_9CLOT|nr:Crp/Fnr family transcriptional regulator [Clostridium cavendishii]SHJ09379.1 cAMP-binding domain of CRP or a regulatory subunit of cAMP-dependent protein kinases [Clostridium cavendishii DSM 21758]
MKSYELINFINNCPNEIKKELKNIKVNFGEKLLIQNEECNYVYILLEGKIKTYHTDFTGTTYLEDIDSEPTIFGELEALIDKKVVTTVETMSCCEVLVISKEGFIKWMELDSKFSLFISKLIAERSYDCCKRESINAFYPLKYRVMYTILNTIYKNNLGITKDLLVEGVGSNIRSINRIINQLVQEEILEYKSGIITIRSIEKLENEVEYYKT